VRQCCSHVSRPDGGNRSDRRVYDTSRFPGKRSMLQLWYVKIINQTKASHTDNAKIANYLIEVTRLLCLTTGQLILYSD
jgi:hypothetical protein